jgi:diguanylate cyclase (GGDEF)-like protein
MGTGFRSPVVTVPNPSRIHAPGGGLSSEGADGRYAGRYARLGAVLMAVTAANALVYFIATPEGSHRALVEILCIVALLVAGLAAAAVGRIVGGRWELAFFSGFMGSALVLIVSVAAADGGSSSPLSVLLILPVVYASISYPLWAVRWNASASQAGILLLMAIGHDWDSEGWFRFVVMAVFNVLAVSSATNRTSYQESERQLAARASHDDLTGCLTHGAFNDQLRTETARARRSGRAFTLLIVDVDHFKGINDSFGHLVGDQILRGVAEALQRGTREGDDVGRLGGDEFGLLLTRTNAVEAAARAEQLREALRGIASPVPVTVSIGSATWSGEDPDGITGLMRRADTALYKAKAQGRDRSISG